MNTPITDSVGRELGRLAASYRCGDLDAAAYARQADQVLQRVAELELAALKLHRRCVEFEGGTRWECNCGGTDCAGQKENAKLLVERDGAKALLDKATALCTKQGEEITALRAKLATEQELRQAAQQDFADLCAFLRGAPPQTYRLHVKEVADKALALVNSYDRAHRLFDVNLVELLQRCQNGEATCIYTAQIIEAELDKLRAEITRLKHEIQTDSWSREMQEALQSIPAQFVKNDYWVNGIKRMAVEVARLKETAETVEVPVGVAHPTLSARVGLAWLLEQKQRLERAEDAMQLLDRLTQVSPWREGSDSVRRCEYCNAVDHDGTETHHGDCPWAQARAAAAGGA